MKFLYFLSILFLLSCNENNDLNKVNKLEKKEVFISELLTSLREVKTDIPENNVMLIDVRFYRTSNKCYISNISVEEPDFLPLEEKSTNSKMNLECINKLDGKSRWFKICDDIQTCTKLFCECMITEECDDSCDRKLIFSPQGNTLYLNVK